MSLESGFLRADDETRRTATDAYGSGDHSGKSGRSARSGSNYIKISDNQSLNPPIELQQGVNREHLH
jgi:hypothetical protein